MRKLLETVECPANADVRYRYPVPQVEGRLCHSPMVLSRHVSANRIPLGRLRKKFQGSTGIYHPENPISSMIFMQLSLERSVKKNYVKLRNKGKIIVCPFNVVRGASESLEEFFFNLI